jgi:hypothetical protein
MSSREETVMPVCAGAAVIFAMLLALAIMALLVC